MATQGSLKMKIDLRAHDASAHSITMLEDDRYKDSDDLPENETSEATDDDRKVNNNVKVEELSDLTTTCDPCEEGTSSGVKVEPEIAGEASKSGDVELLSISLKTHKDNLRKRKRIGNLEKVEAKLSNDVRDAQKREKERLERQAKRQNEMDHINQMASLISSASLPLIEAIDDEDFFGESSIGGKKSKDMPTTSEHDVVTLSSDDDDDVVAIGGSYGRGPPAINQSYTSYGRPITLSNRGRWGSHHEEAAQQNLRQQRDFERKRLRKRRNSGDLESKELTEGKLLVNSGRPEGDAPIYVAPHLTHTLQPHQLAGIRFMFDNVIDSISEFKKSDGFGCILAHSMGLGKTIQVITFSELFFRATESKKILVIVPINTIQNWYAEYQKWLPEYGDDGNRVRKFPVFLLGDAIKGLEQRIKLIEEWDREGGVLLIGYEMFRLIINSTKSKKEKKMVQRSSNLRDNFDEKEDLKENFSTEDERSTESLQEIVRAALLDPGPDLVVCDEGHKIKNLNTATATALNEIRTKRRIVLTGTPLQNNLIEYFCMVDFVRPNYLGTKKSFIQMFEKPIKNGQCTDSTAADQKLARQRTHILTESLRGFVQRRTHRLLKEILPECKEYVLYLRKSPIQHILYRAFILYAQQEISTGNTGTFNPLKAFSACSKIWNHPDVLHAWLQRRRELDMKIENDKRIELETNQKKKQASFMNNQWMLPPNDFSKNGNFSQLNGNQAGVNQQSFDYFYHSSYPNASSSYMNSPMGSSPASMHSMPGISQHTQQQMPIVGGGYDGYGSSNFSSLTIQPNTNLLSGQQPPFNSVGQSSMQSGFGYMNELPNFDELDQIWASTGTSKDDFSANHIRPPIEQQLNSSITLSPDLSVGKSPEKKTRGGGRGGKPQTLLSALQEELDMDVGLKYDWAEVAMSSYARGVLENGYKLVVAMALINEATKRDEKILLFSQNLTTLDVLEEFLSRTKVETSEGPTETWQKNGNYFRFDGTTAGVEREKLITKFNEDPSIRLFIISTRAGSLGINLVSANRCIIFDACWNPCHDSQAVCRVYRYGQKRRTYIYRLVMDNSMERAIFNRQVSKNGLAQRVVDDVQVDPNLTQKELETLLVYEEALDLHREHQNIDSWEIEDEVLKYVATEHSNTFAGKPILHESLMLESEDKLSEEEKREAQLLFEKEKNRDTFESKPWNRFGPSMSAPMLNLVNVAPGPAPLQSTPVPGQLRFMSYKPGGGATMASLPPGYSSQNPNSCPMSFDMWPRYSLGTVPSRYENFSPNLNLGNSNDASISSFNPNLQSMNPFSNIAKLKNTLLSRLQTLTGAHRIGEPEFKDADRAILQKIVLDQDITLRICQEGLAYDRLARGMELTLVLNQNGTFAKDSRTKDGKVYSCKNTPFDLGFYDNSMTYYGHAGPPPIGSLRSSGPYFAPSNDLPGPRPYNEPLKFYNPFKGRIPNTGALNQIPSLPKSTNSGTTIDECIELD